MQELERSNGHLRRECEERAKEIANLSAAKINAEKTAASMEVRLKTYETTATARTGEWEQAKASYQALLNKKSAEIRKLSDDLARLQEQGEVTSMREKELRDQTAAQSTNAQALALELENTRATLDQTVGKVEKLERGAADLRRQRKALQDDIKELEGLLGASEAERKELRARYVDLGEKMEMLLREEKATKEQSDRDILAVDVLAAEKAEIRDKAKQMKKAKVRLEQVCTELQSENAQLRQTLEDRSEKLSISEKRVQILVKKQQEHQQQFDAQLGVLKGQIEELEGALEKSRRRCEAVRKDVQKELEERADLELRQLEVKYERRVQELELEVRHLRTLDQNQQQSLFQQYVEAKLESIRLLEDPRVKDRTMDDHIERRVKAVLDECISKEEHAQKLTMARGEVTRDFSMRMDKVKADCDAKVSTITTEWRERLVESERKWATRELERVKEVEDRVRKECSAQLATAASERERLEEEMASLKAETENAVRAAEDSEKIATERARALIQLEERLEEEEAGRRKAHKRAEELHRDLIKVRAELQEERTKLVATESALQADRARVLELTAGGERAAKEVQRLKDALTRAEQAAVREREELTRTLRAEADHALGQIKSEQETAALDGRIRAENAAAAVEAMRRDMREVADLVRNKTLGPALERAVRGLEERTNQLEGALRLLGSNSGPAFAAAASAPSVLALPATPLTFTHAHAQPHDISLSTPGFGPAANAINRAHAQDSVALLERLLQESRRESADLRDQMASTFRDLDRAKSHLASLEGKVTAAQAAADKADAEHEESSKRCKALAAELESALQDASILRGKLHEEVERRTADRSAHEEHTCRLEAAFAERSESMRRQSEALAEDLRGEVERVRSQWKAEVGEIERRFQDRLALADQENRMLGSQVRTETEREVKNELLRVHQAAMMEAEALHGQLQGQINAFQIKFEKVRAVLGPYADMLDDELRLDPAAEASLRTVELRTRLDQEVERCRVLSDAKDEMAKELKKLKTRIERREEDFTIVLMNIREVLGLDTSSTTIEDGLLSADKARFTQSLNRMRTLLTQALEKRQMAAISEALDDMGGGASAEDPSPSVTVARRARKEREQALQAEVVQLRSKVQEREREFTVLQQQGEDLKGKSDKVDKELAAAREELAETKAKLLESERALAQAHEEVGRTAKLLESSKAEATRVQVDLKKHLEAVEGELAAAREEGRTTAASLNQAKRAYSSLFFSFSSCVSVCRSINDRRISHFQWSPRFPSSIFHVQWRWARCRKPSRPSPATSRPPRLRLSAQGTRLKRPGRTVSGLLWRPRSA